jgi:WD40 repeat protein
LIATGGRDGYITLWDVLTGEKLFSIEAHRKGVNSVTFDPQGQLIATGGNDAVARLWEVDTGNNVAQMIGGTFAVPAISFTPDGNSLAIVNGQVIRLRDVESSRFVITINGEASFNAIDISPDGHRLVAGDSVNVVTIWDISSSGSTQAPITKLEPTNQPPELVWQVKFSPDGQLLASAHNDGTVNLWEVSTGKSLAALSGPSRATTSLAFSPDGNYLATGSLDGSLSLWAVVP